MCNGNGRCTLGNSGWYCVCQLGWRGTGCDTSMETACTDVKDNDGGKNHNITLNKLRQEHLISHDHNIKNIGFSQYAGLLCFCPSWLLSTLVQLGKINDSETVARTTGFLFFFSQRALWLAWVPGHALSPGVCLCPLTSLKQSHPHTKATKQLHRSWGQVKNMTFFLPKRIPGWSYILVNLIHAAVVCLTQWGDDEALTVKDIHCRGFD